MTRRGVVLGGGGVAGIAWETGILLGLSEAGVSLLAAEKIVGTSAGATVAAQVTGPLSLPELYRRQIDPALQVPELPAALDPEAVMALWGQAYEAAEGPEDLRRRLGAMALAAPTVPEAERRAVIEARLPGHEWPERDLAIVAVDALSGGVRVFDRRSGVNLVDAVAASCAVPGTWPPHTIGDRRYVDGGVRSGENADLAAGCDRVVVFQVMELPGSTDLDEQVALLRERGSGVLVVRPDEASKEAMGPNLLDPAVRAASAEAGFEQGRREAAALAEFWG
ncbi:patatin-like phospholipase family protein [Amycolatopsis rhizosphaerae]|uniref:Patatin-like phospholipase family protein n=1 Tax=Amycolatopsis rhizosphaerae TaxID=2053003 RepID=A0A558AWI5_9PSEU|nr:patatin-like phospholipase family protein [Amycolatopsis rhizosphaerae]TVT28622.1 patatin-like phospholipase family protein [Amycolatopsis rhizosphaerae]